jgi:hypothetical protein
MGNPATNPQQRQRAVLQADNDNDIKGLSDFKRGNTFCPKNLSTKHGRRGCQNSRAARLTANKLVIQLLKFIF